MADDYSAEMGRLVDRLENRRKAAGQPAGPLQYFFSFARGLYGREIGEIKKPGKKVVGTLCDFVPEELIIAAGAVPLRLCGGTLAGCKRAEQDLPANFCPMIKSTYGQFIENSPLFAAADVVVAPTTCDGKKKLCELIADGKDTWLLEVPHTGETPAARAHWLSSLDVLRRELESLTGSRITSKSLRAAIELCNAKRAAVMGLYSLRKGADPPVTGAESLLVTGVSFYDDPARFTKELNSAVAALRGQPPAVPGAQRLALTGSPLLLPSLKVAVIAEEAGGIIVVDDVCSGLKPFMDPVLPSRWGMDDLMVALAHKYLMNTCACLTPNTARLTRLHQIIRDWDAKGVVYFTLQGCQAYSMEAIKVLGELKGAGIPALRIETDYGEQDTGQLKTRLEAFGEMLQSKSA